MRAGVESYRLSHYGSSSFPIAALSKIRESHSESVTLVGMTILYPSVTIRLSLFDVGLMPVKPLFFRHLPHRIVARPYLSPMRIALGSVIVGFGPT